MHLKLHYRIALINNEQSEYIKHSDFFNFDDFKRYRHKNKKNFQLMKDISNQQAPKAQL